MHISRRLAAKRPEKIHAKFLAEATPISYDVIFSLGMRMSMTRGYCSRSKLAVWKSDREEFYSYLTVVDFAEK